MIYDERKKKEKYDDMIYEMIRTKREQVCPIPRS